MNFSEILIARADNFKDYNLVLKLDINPDDFMHPDYANTGKYIGWSGHETIYTGGIPDSEKNYPHGRMFLYWGNFDVNNLYYFRDHPTSSAFGLHPYWFNTYSSGAIYGSFHQKHGMILVR